MEKIETYFQHYGISSIKRYFITIENNLAIKFYGIDMHSYGMYLICNKTILKLQAILKSIFFWKRRSRKVYMCRHDLFDCTSLYSQNDLCRHCYFYELKVYGNSTLSKCNSTIFFSPTFACFMSLCHILIILTVSQAF